MSDLGSKYLRWTRRDIEDLSWEVIVLYHSEVLRRAKAETDAYEEERRKAEARR